MVDSCMTRLAEHQSFALPGDHDLLPQWYPPSLFGEICQLVDVVDFHCLRRLTEFAFPGTQTAGNAVVLLNR
jgi:hypothetical protein